ncbi:MAG: FtsQ-type POTRA domain-containing protein [Deltaproteobacteria bacterium]|nr:FtsQ-type POTRA domain-containing protein [Deltaproteobacteria bacterium]
MERSRLATEARPAAQLPRASRLVLKKNRRKSAPLRTRLPSPTKLIVSCGHTLRRAAPTMLALIGVAAVGTGAYAGYRFLTTSPRFAVTSIEVTGTHVLGADELRARLPFTTGANVFTADLSAAEAALATEPWIAEVHVSRELPHTIVVDVREREASAIVDLDGLYLADRTGHVFKRAALERGEGANLPVVTGLGRDSWSADPEGGAAAVAHALAALADWRVDTGRPSVAEVHLDPGGLTLYTTDSAVAIRLGDGEPDALTTRMHTFDRAWAALSPDERTRARSIHVDNHIRPDHVTVAFN